MKKVYFLLPIVTLMLLTIISCKKEDDGVVFVPIRDRGEEAIVAEEEIVAFLSSHFYNYEEFNAPPADFDFVIDIDTIAGENASKTPLIEQVSTKMVQDRVDEDVTYTLYYLNVLQGEGESIAFPDIGTISYEGRNISDKSLFDASVTPVRFDLTQVVDGFQDALTEFNAASIGPLDEDGDGNVEYENFGVGAVFIPSGLAYFLEAPTSIGAYSQIYFSFKLYQAEVGDQDEDGIISIMEDLNGNGLEEDDDTDEDGFPNYFDADDDGDGTLSSEEVVSTEYIVNVGEDEPVLASNEFETFREIDEDGVITITTVTLTDTDGDGTPDYLDTDNS